MSLRNLKKAQEAKSPLNPVIDSDDDFEPLCVRKTSRSTYEGLYLSSSSSEEESKDKEATLTDTEKELNGNTSKDPQPGCSSKPEVEKKKKKQKKKKSSRAAGDYMDEIERSVSEVNALLGEPTKEPALHFKDELPQDEDKSRLFTIKNRYLSESNELLRLFGPDSENEPRKKQGRRPQFKRIHRCKIVQKDFSFKKLGLSMSIVRRDRGLTYFVYNHNEDYQKMHREFLSYISLRNINLMAPIDSYLKNMHVEALIEASDMMFRIEDNSAGNDIIEEAIAYMEYIAHPSFDILDLNTRLEYKYFENRAFHIMILKYIHLLSNRACHRTALELAKLLMNLDTSDPLAVVLIIDILAIRAREYQWLVEAIDYLDKEREAGYLFNMKFSKALAHFYILIKERRGDMNSCDEMIQHALLAYPWALREILDVANRSNEAVLAHKLFDDFARKTTSKYLKQLIHLYAAFTSTQWRDPRVLEWFLRNANEVAQANVIPDTYDEEEFLMSGALSLEGIRRYMFRTYPEQIQRHLTVIKTMSSLLVEGAVPEVTSTRSFDPIPPRDGINRYGYVLQPRTQINRGSAILADFFASLMPNYDIPQEGGERRE